MEMETLSLCFMSVICVLLVTINPIMCRPHPGMEELSHTNNDEYYPSYSTENLNQRYRTQDIYPPDTDTAKSYERGFNKDETIDIEDFIMELLQDHFDDDVLNVDKEEQRDISNILNTGTDKRRNHNGKQRKTVLSHSIDDFMEKQKSSLLENFLNANTQKRRDSNTYDIKFLPSDTEKRKDTVFGNLLNVAQQLDQIYGGGARSEARRFNAWGG